MFCSILQCEVICTIKNREFVNNIVFYVLPKSTIMKINSSIVYTIKEEKVFHGSVSKVQEENRGREVIQQGGINKMTRKRGYNRIGLCHIEKKQMMMQWY